MSVYFLLLKHNAQDWVIYIEIEFNLDKGPQTRKSENMEPVSADLLARALGSLSSCQEDAWQVSANRRQKCKVASEGPPS